LLKAFRFMRASPVLSGSGYFGVRRLLAPPSPWRLGGDDERVVAASSEEAGDTQDAVGDTVDVGGKDSVMMATLMVTPCDINRSRHRSRHDVQANLP
jgi:hypothetical protein